jgi:hypothetical protein
MSTVRQRLSFIVDSQFVVGRPAASCDGAELLRCRGLCGVAVVRRFAGNQEKTHAMPESSQ